MPEHRSFLGRGVRSGGKRAKPHSEGSSAPFLHVSENWRVILLNAYSRKITVMQGRGRPRGRGSQSANYGEHELRS